MKKNLGVTLIELVIVIVIIMIIAAFALSSGRETVNEANATSVYAEMNSVLSAINGVVAKQNMDEDFTIEKGKHYDKEFVEFPGVSYSGDILNNEDKNKWFIIYGADAGDLYEESEVKENLGLEALALSYIVNFEDVKVGLYKPVKILNNTVRTYEEVRSLASN